MTEFNFPVRKIKTLRWSLPDWVNMLVARNIYEPALCRRSGGGISMRDFARWINMLPACWNRDTGDKEQGYPLQEPPGAGCGWTSVMFHMKHCNINDSQYQWEHLMREGAHTAEAGTSAVYPLRTCDSEPRDLPAASEFELSPNPSWSEGLKVDYVCARSDAGPRKKIFFPSKRQNPSSHLSQDAPLYMLYKRCTVTL